MDKSDLHARAAELEQARDAIREELDGILRELAEGDEDSFAMRFAQKKMDERDDALRRVKELESMLAGGQTDLEAAFASLTAAHNSLVLHATAMRTRIGTIINDPKLPRDQVQSRLMLIWEKVRDEVWQ